MTGKIPTTDIEIILHFDEFFKLEFYVYENEQKLHQ